MTISDLIQELVKYKATYGNKIIPKQFPYEPLYKNGKINETFINKFHRLDLFDYYVEELEIRYDDIRICRVCFDITCSYDLDTAAHCKKFLDALLNAKIPHIRNGKKYFYEH